jgi:hypothetical protein
LDSGTSSRRETGECAVLLMAILGYCQNSLYNG